MTGKKERETKARKEPKRRRRAEHDQRAEANKRRRLTESSALAGPSSSPAAPSAHLSRTTVGLSDNEFLERQRAAYFSHTSDASVSVKIKPEPGSDEESGYVSHGGRPKTPIVPVTRPSSLPASTASTLLGPSNSANASGRETSTDRQGALVSVLVQSVGSKLTEASVEEVLEDARRTACPGNDLGIEHVEALVHQLDRNGIEEERRTEVVSMLQLNLQKWCSDLSSRIQSLQSFKAATPADSEVIQVADPRDTLRKPSGRIESKYFATHAPAGGSQTGARHTNGGLVRNPDLDEISSSNSDDEDDHEDEEDSDEYTEPIKVKSPAKPKDTPATASMDKAKSRGKRNVYLRLYGIMALPRSRFDGFAQCVIAVGTGGSADETAAVHFREEARSIWRSVSKQDKTEWEVLFSKSHALSIEQTVTEGKTLFNKHGVWDLVTSARIKFKESNRNTPGDCNGFRVEEACVPGSSAPSSMPQKPTTLASNGPAGNGPAAPTSEPARKPSKSGSQNQSLRVC